MSGKKKNLSANMWGSVWGTQTSLFANKFFCMKKMMSSEGELQDIDIKLFIKSINKQFQRMNARLDDIQSLANSKSTRRQVIADKEDEDLNMEETNSQRSKKDVSKRDGNLGSIKMSILAFQG